MMGRHPGDLISSISVSTGHQILFKDVSDQRRRTPNSRVTEELVNVAKLEFVCVDASPQSRPTMQQVSHKMSIRKPNHASLPQVVNSKDTFVETFDAVELAELFGRMRP